MTFKKRESENKSNIYKMQKDEVIQGRLVDIPRTQYGDNYVIECDNGQPQHKIQLGASAWLKNLIRLSDINKRIRITCHGEGKATQGKNPAMMYDVEFDE